MIPEAREVRLKPKVRKVLEARCRAPSTAQRDVRRARIVLAYRLRELDDEFCRRLPAAIENGSEFCLPHHCEHGAMHEAAGLNYTRPG
jgi:hypothetical protein